jgi:hypothetical protein
MSGKRSTKAETMQRVHAVLKIVLFGAEFHDLRDFADKEGWNVSDSTLRRYQTAALELCREQQEQNRERLLARHLMQRRALYARAMESGDWRTALAIATDEAALLGLYPTGKARIELTGEDGKPIETKTSAKIEHAIALTADDIAAARRLVDATGDDVPADSGTQPVDTPNAA